MIKAYVLNQRIDKEFNAAGKAMEDVFEIFTRNGIKIMPGVPKDAKKILKLLDFPILAIYCLFLLNNKSIIIYSYPENSFKIRFLRKLCNIKKIKLVCFINDINSIRDGHFEDPSTKELIKKDMELIGCSDIIIAPNNNSKEFLEGQGVKSSILTVGVWDYIIKDELGFRGLIHSEGDTWKIAFAGNLDKAGFISKLNEVAVCDITYKLWGNASDNFNVPNNCEYMGSVSPKELPYRVCECHFGLVWDGVGVHSIKGGIGEYLKYNNSHKCGLYLASNIPVFVWRQSGLADFVIKNQCGFVIDSLDDINSILSKLTVDEYAVLLNNVERVASNIRCGYYLEQTIIKLLKK